MENVQVLLLATGETDKLLPVTKKVPSPMVPVVDKPIMVYAVESLARQNIKNISVSLYHLAGEVEAYFGQGQRWGVELDYILQREAWGSAGSIKWAQASLNKTIVIIPGDIIIDFDIAEILAFHRSKRSQASVVVHRVGNEDTPIVCLDENNYLTVDKGITWYSTGVYIFEPGVLNYIPDRTVFDIHSQLLPALLAEDIPVHGYEIQGYWNPINNFQDHQDVQRHVLNSASNNLDDLNRVPALRNPLVESQQISPGIWVGRNHMIHPSVRLSPPIYVGNNCQVGSDVELGPDVVVGSNVMIDDDATVCNSTIMDHTYIGQLVNIDRRFVDKNIVIDSLTSESTEVVDHFLLDEAHPTILDNRLLRIWDFLLALIIALVTLIITVPLALLLLLTSGHIFQKVTRVGGWPTASYNGNAATLQSFKLLRFYTRKKDGRYAFLGRWLEHWEGHRLPELWNVIKGDISLVGVKPLTTENIAQITETWQQKRHDYYPGFTGIWYLQTNQSSGLDDILIADAYYVATRTWREDLKILLNTPSAWWQRYKNWKTLDK
jgi:NDP-sugar pyrophosphorylase family protein